MSVLLAVLDHVREWVSRPSQLVNERIASIDELSRQILEAERRAKEKSSNGRH